MKPREYRYHRRRYWQKLFSPTGGFADYLSSVKVSEAFWLDMKTGKYISESPASGETVTITITKDNHL